VIAEPIPFVRGWNFGWLSTQLLPGAPYSACGATLGHTLGIALERQTGVHAIASDFRQDFDTWSGALAYTPPGMEVFSESACGGEYLLIEWQEPEDARVGIHSPCFGQHFRPTVIGHGGMLKLGRELRRVHLQPCPDLAYIEALAVQFIAVGTQALREPKSKASSIADQNDFATVLNHIEDALCEPLCLAELSALVGLPVLPFLRRFSAAFGTTPHAFIIERRLQRARRLLQLNRYSIAEIAFECGFSHQSHLGKCFRRELGLSPLDYRRLLWSSSASGIDSRSVREQGR